MRSSLGLPTAALLLGALLVSGAVSADWLVATDGSRLETRGPWEIKGQAVWFTSTNGQLSSLRLADVDLDASEALTAEMNAPPAPADEEPAPPRQSVYRITDADVGHVDPDDFGPGSAQEEPPAEGPNGSPAEEATEGQIRVVRWNQVPDDSFDGARVSGTLRNETTTLATSVTVVMRAYNSSGLLVAEAPATLLRDSLAQGQTTEFEVSFPELNDLAAARFDIASRPYAARYAQEPAEDDDDADQR